MSDLRLPLKRKWFDVTSPDEKTEDYRKINEYWVKRLFHYKESKLTTEEIVRYINHYKYYGYVDVSAIFTYHDLSFKQFEQNIIALGYPKLTDTSKIKRFKHAGIEIKTGKPEWGAEPGKLYFVIKHGKEIK
jgi:hypothetical protein